MKDKVVIITGAARGLGQKYAIEFAKIGAKIIFADINSCSDTENKINKLTDNFLNQTVIEIFLYQDPAIYLDTVQFNVFYKANAINFKKRKWGK